MVFLVFKTFSTFQKKRINLSFIAWVSSFFSFTLLFLLSVHFNCSFPCIKMFDLNRCLQIFHCRSSVLWCERNSMDLTSPLYKQSHCSASLLSLSFHSCRLYFWILPPQISLGQSPSLFSQVLDTAALHFSFPNPNLAD